MDELAAVTSHPTADEVFRMVRERLPRVSLATVYRNLDLLAEAGLIQRLHVGGLRMRFDANAENHTHIRCVECGRVDDALVEPGEDLARAFQGARGYEVTGYRLELVGLCPDCAVSRSGQSKESVGCSEKYTKQAE